MVIPTTADEDVWVQVRARLRRGLVTIAWAAGLSTVSGLLVRDGLHLIVAAMLAMLASANASMLYGAHRRSRLVVRTGEWVMALPASLLALGLLFLSGISILLFPLAFLDDSSPGTGRIEALFLSLGLWLASGLLSARSSWHVFGARSLLDSSPGAASISPRT